MAEKRGFITYLGAGAVDPREKKLLRKIDFFILTFCCLMYFANYLDRSNLAQAYVSGMQEEIHFEGNQFNQINSIFTAGYIIGMIPSNLALTYTSPRIFFPTMMLIWGGLTMCTAAAQKPQDIMAIRFFQGLAESSTFVGTHYILGSWYTETELGKRSGLFTASGLAGTLFGGFLQTGIYKGMNGLRGLSGWRWLFIIDGLITIPIALYGLLLFPNTPSTTTAFYLTTEERELAVSRVPTPQETPLLSSPTSVLKSLTPLLKSWKLYGFTILWVIAGETESFSSNSLLNLWMKAQKRYTVPQLNNYPSGVPAVGIISTLFWATLTDYWGGRRYLVGYFIGIIGVVTSIMILVRPEDEATVFAAYYIAGSVYACQATFFAWANDSLRFSPPLHRALVIASMNLWSNVTNAWWSIVFYSAYFAPAYTRGAWAMIGCSIVMAVWTSGLVVMERRGKQRGLAPAGEESGIEGEVVEESSRAEAGKGGEKGEMAV